MLKLTKNDEALWVVIKAVIDNFDKLPEDMRNLLLKLTEIDEATRYVANVVAGNFDKFPENVKNLLDNL
ncbi:MAG: hypothetical protein HF967_00705 [Methanosarcinales archaeon]|nr:hypothetical protein [Methanosarcinales archaeon]